MKFVVGVMSIGWVCSRPNAKHQRESELIETALPHCVALVDPTKLGALVVRSRHEFEANEKQVLELYDCLFVWEG